MNNMSNEENIRLLKEYQQTKDKRIRAKLVENNIQLVWDIATTKANRYNLEVDTLFSYGCEALLRVIDTYNENYAHTFHSYLVVKINQIINRFIEKEVYLSKQYHDIIQERIKEYEAIYGETLQENPAMIHYILSSLVDEGVFRESTAKIYEGKFQTANHLPLSSCNNIACENDGPDYKRLKDEEKKQMNQVINEALDMLSDREKMIIQYYYGIGVEKQSESKIASEFNICIQRANKLRHEALEKLKANEKLQYFH